VQERYAEFVRLGSEVLVVSFAKPEMLAPYLAKRPLAFPVVADPSRAAHRAFGLERASWSAILGIRSILAYLRLILRGWMPRRANEGEDVLQLGGDFVLDAHGRVIYSHRSAQPTDRPPIAELIYAVGRAASVS
jgi:hypothetical protein